jgi:hypothetical protein
VERSKNERFASSLVRDSDHVQVAWTIMGGVMGTLVALEVNRWWVTGGGGMCGERLAEQEA